MNSKQEERLKLLAGELAQDIKTGEDLSALNHQISEIDGGSGTFRRVGKSSRLSAAFTARTSQREFPQRQFAQDIERHARRSFD